MSLPPPAASLPTPRLPEGWSAPQTFADTVSLGETVVGRVGLAVAGPGGLEVTGSAAQVGEPPHARALFELLERVATLEAEGRGTAAAQDPAFRYARSNGVALHDSLEEARARAQWELGERHLVLKAWFGDIRPERISLDVRETAFRGVDGWDVRAYAFRDDGASRAACGVVGAGVFAFPRKDDLPLAMGFAARPTETDALASALGEAVQNAAFLWGEDLPAAAPAVGPSPLHHLEYYQHRSRHAALEAWLDGGHLPFRGALAKALALAGPDAPVTFEDITPAWAAPMHVVRARCDSAVPLVFGSPPWVEALPLPLRVHPIA